MAADVATVYFALPPAQRARAAIYADTYGDAGALDFFGPRFGLPAAISSQNTYYLWGPRGYDGSTLVAIGATRIDAAAPLLSQRHAGQDLDRAIQMGRRRTRADLRVHVAHETAAGDLARLALVRRVAIA